MWLDNKEDPKWKLNLTVEELWDEIVGEDHHIVPVLSLAIIAALRRLHLAFPEREYVTLGEMMDIVWRQTGEADFAILNYLSYLSRAQLICTNGRGSGHEMQIKLLAFRPPLGPQIPKYEIVGYAPILREVKESSKEPNQ